MLKQRSMTPRPRFRPALCGLLALAFAVSGACRQNPDVAKRRYLESGDRYAAAGKYAEAVLEYRNAVQRAPLAADAREKLAQALMRSGNVPGALGEYVRAADLAPENTALQIQAGNLLLIAGRFDDAKARGEQALARDKQNVDASILIANATAGLKDLDGAVAQVEDALKIDPDHSGTYSALGQLELNRGKRDAAERAFQKAVALAPTSVPAQLALGHFYWSTGNAPAAEQAFTQALAIEPRNALTNRILGNFYIATNRLPQARPYLETTADVMKTAEASFALADYDVAVGDAAAARAIWTRYVDDPAVAPAARVRLAQLDFREGHHDDAYRGIAAVLAKDQRNLQALLVKSAMQMADGQADQALATATLATERHPESTSAFYTLGRVQTLRRQPDAAIAAFQETLRLNPRATEAKLALARLHLAQGRPDTSIGFAQEALASEPGNADAQLLVVRGLLARGDLDRASTELKQLLARFPNAAAVHTQMGMLLGRRRDNAGARREFERAAELDPRSLEPLTGLVVLDLTTKQFAAARARVDARLARDSSSSLFVLAARTYAATGDAAAAERFLRRAIDVDSGDLAAYGALGQLYVQQGRLDDARVEFDRIAKQSAKPVGALTMIGIIAQAKGDLAQAQAQFERALQIDPEAAVAANNLAWIYAEHGGNLDVALHLAQVAQKRLPEVSEVGDTLGYIYYKKNLAPLAISTLTVVTAKDPANATFQYHLGLAYAGAGDAKRARQSLAQALQLQPDFAGAHEARELLNSLPQ